MIKPVGDLRVINVLAKFINDPWKIMDVRVLTGLVCPAARPPARPPGVRQYPGALKGCGVKTHSKKGAHNSHIVVFRAVRSTDFRNRLTVRPNSNRIRLTKRFASPYGALCFHVFTGSDSPPGPSRLSLQVVSLLVSNQTSVTQIKRQSKIITCGVLCIKTNL